MANRFQSSEKESYWRWHVDTQAVGSLSVRAYCGKHGLLEQSFYAWRRKIQTRDSGHDFPPGSQPESQSLISEIGSRNRSAETGQDETSRSNKRHLSVCSNGDSLQPSIGTRLVALDIIETAGPTLAIEGPGGIVIRLREDVSVEVLRRVIAACQLSHSTAAARSQERSC